MNSKGWIKLDRRIMDNDFLWGNGEPFDRRAAWVDLLLMAAHKDTAYCKRGQIVTSIRELAERWTWGRNRVYRFLRDTERAGMVTTSGTSSGTTITIENYSKYQSGRDTNGTPSQTTNVSAARTIFFLPTLAIPPRLSTTAKHLARDISSTLAPASVASEFSSASDTSTRKSIPSDVSISLLRGEGTRKTPFLLACT